MGDGLGIGQIHGDGCHAPLRPDPPQSGRVAPQRQNVMPGSDQFLRMSQPMPLVAPVANAMLMGGVLSAPGLSGMQKRLPERGPDPNQERWTIDKICLGKRVCQRA